MKRGRCSDAWGSRHSPKALVITPCDSPQSRMLPPGLCLTLGSQGLVESELSKGVLPTTLFAIMFHTAFKGLIQRPEASFKGLTWLLEDIDIWRSDNNTPKSLPFPQPQQGKSRGHSSQQCLQWETFKWPKSFSPSSSHWSFQSF